MLPEKYPEFRYIYQEYHDGILLFDIMDQNGMVKSSFRHHWDWKPSMKSHKNDYMWQQRSEAIM